MSSLISDGFRGCPSCGGQPHVMQSHKKIWKAECVDEACPMIIEVRGATVEDVRQKWNHRPGEEILCERIADLERIVDADEMFVQHCEDEVERLEAELAKLRAEQWQPVEDGEVNTLDRAWLIVGHSAQETRLTSGYPDWPPVVVYLPPSIRLCKRGES